MRSLTHLTSSSVNDGRRAEAVIVITSNQNSPTGMEDVEHKLSAR